MESLEQRPDEVLTAAAATVRFALSASRAAGAPADELPRARLLLADGHLGVAPFEGIRVDQLELDAGTVTPAEIAAGPSGLRNRRAEVRRLHFSVDEGAVERLLRTQIRPDAGIESLHARLFPDHVRVYLVLSGGGTGPLSLTDGPARAVLCASIDVDEGGSFVLSFYDIRVFGRMRAGVVPSRLFDLVAAEGRHVERGGATRFTFAPQSLLLTAWLPAAGWKVPDVSRAQDRHVTVRGDRLYFHLSQTATPGLVSETTTARNLAAFEYAEAERLFEPGEAKLRDGDLDGAAEAFAAYGDPETGHPFALRRLAWIRTAQAAPGTAGLSRAAEARRIAEGLKRRFPDDPVALETLAALAVGPLADRAAAAETFEALATRCNEENDLKGRVFAELFLGELYSAPGEGQELQLARASYEAALALEDDCLAARKAVAEVYVRIGEPAKAIESWLRVLEMTAEPPERKRFLLRIADAHLLGLNDPESAIRVYREAQEGDDPDAPTVAAWEGLARAYAAKGDAPAAIRQLERVADRCTAVGDKRGAARANFGIGELWAGPLKRPESALMRFERSLELDPQHVGALEKRYRLQLERRSLPQAVQSGHRLAEALLAAEDEDDGEPRIAAVDARYAALQVLLQVAETAGGDMNDPSAAGVAAGRALEIEPASGAAREACERFFARTGDWRGLAALFGRAAESAEGVTPAAAYELRARRATVLLERLDDASGAAEELAAAAAVAPDAERLAIARARLADVLRGLKRLPALRELRAEEWKALPAGPERAEIAVDIGRLSRELGDPGGAALWFERATEDDRERGDAFAALSELAADRGDVAGHVRALQRRAGAERDAGMRARLRVQAAGLLLESLDDAEGAQREAEAAAKEADELVPADAYRILGRAALARGDADLAARSLEEWFTRTEAHLAPTGGIPIPDRAAMAGEIAAVHARRKDDGGELRWLRVRLEADPIDARATRRAAALARALGPPELAAELVEADARLTSDRAQSSELFLEAGRIWEEHGSSPRAEAAFRHAAATVPQDETPLLALEKLLLGEGRWEEAVDVWRASADALPGAAAAPRWRRAGVLATQRLGDAEVAARCFSRLLALEPDDRHALSFLAERARASGAWVKARDLYERLAQATVDAPPAEEAQLAMRRAEAAERSGDVPAAEQRYRLAASLEPVAREPWKALRRLAVAAGRHDDAADALEQEAVRTAEVGEKAALLAEAGKLAHEKLNDPKRAALRYREALDLAPENMPALDALESILQSLEDWNGLIQVLRDKARLLRDGRRRSELLRRAAEVAWERLGDVERASEDAVAARAAAPDDTRPIAFLEKMYRAERKWDRLAPLLEERARAMPAPSARGAPDGEAPRAPDAGGEPEAREALVVEAAGIRARELGEADRAATDLERALLEGHAGKDLLVLLADLQERRGEHARLANALIRLLPHLAGAEKSAALLRIARAHGDGMNDGAAALRWLSEAHAADPADREIALEYKQRLAGAKRWNELAALELSLAARASDQKEAAAAYRRAGILFRDRVDDAAAAVKAFRKALAADPDDAESLAAADTLLVSRGDHATRAELFRRQIEARPDDAVSREGLLASLAAGGRWTELEAELKPFADAEPVGGPSVRRMLLAFRAAGRWKDLVRFLEARVTGGEAAARDLLEAVFAEREDWRGLADFHLRQAEGKGGRERARAVAQAASVLRERTHDLDRSRAVLRDAVAERPEDVELLEAAGEAFEAAGDMEGLRDLLVDAAGSSEGPVRARHLARAAEITKARLGDSTRALALWREVLAGNPDDDQAAEAAVEILAARHDWPAVVALWMDRAERGRDPRRRLGYYKTAAKLSRTRLSDPVKAAAAYRAALVIDPGDAEAAAGAEEALEAAERWDELSSLRAARAGLEGSGPERAQSLIAAARIARDRAGDARKALDLFRQAVAESPGEIAAIDAAAALLAGLERWDELVEWMTSTADALPPAEAATRRLGAVEVLLDNSTPPGPPAERIVSILLRNLDSAAPGGALTAAVNLLESRDAWDALHDLYVRTLDLPGLALQRAATLAAIGVIVRDRRGDLTQAVEWFRRSYELDATSAQAFVALEAWYRDKADWDALLAIYETDAGLATEAAPKAARLAAMAEIRSRELGDPAGAAADYRRALEALPGDSELARLYEDALERAGMVEELAEALVARAGRTSAPASAAALTIRAADLLAGKPGKLDRAIALYAAAKANAASPEEPLLGLERIFRKQQAFAQLAAILEERGTLSGPPAARAFLMLEAGVIRRARLDDPAGALADLQAAIALDPTSIETLRELRELHRSEHRWVAVDETLDSEEALSQGESDELRAALAYERGILFRDGFKDMTRAAFHLGRAVKLAPGDAAASLALAEISESLKAFPVARREWMRLAARAEGSARIPLLQNAARCAAAEGDTAGVVELLEDAVEADPDRLDSWDALSDGYLSVRRWDEARLVLGELLARTSKAGDAARTLSIYYRLAKAERLTNQTDKAAGRLKRLLSAEPEHAGALVMLADIHREREEWPALAELLPTLAKVQEPRERSDTLRELGGLLEHRLGRTADAMEVFGSALRENPEDYESLWRLSELAFQNDRHDVFLGAWARLSGREEAPARKLALSFRAGEALRRTGRPQEAAKEYEKALEVDSTHLPSWIALAGLLEEMREWRRAVAAYDGALRVLSGNAGQRDAATAEREIQVLVRRGTLLAERVGDYEAAAADLKLAVERKPDDLTLRFRHAGVLAKAKGRTVDAVRELQEILRRDPFRAEVYRALGEIHAGSQSIDRAFAAFSALALLEPTDVAAKAFLDANRSKIDQGMLKALEETVRLQLLTHPAAKTEPLRAGMMALVDVVQGVFGTPIDRAGLIAVDLASGTGLARLLDSIRARLGLSALSVFVRPAAIAARRASLADLVLVDVADGQPALVVDDTLVVAVPDRRGALFILGKFLERLKGGQTVYLRMSHDDVDHLAMLIRKSFDPAAGTLEVKGMPAEQVAAAIKAFRKNAPRKAKKEIDELASAITPERLHAWIDGLRHSENRAGLLVSNDLVQAAKVVLALDPDLGKTELDAAPDRLAHLKKSEEIAEMLRYVGSDEFHDLRKSVGLTLDSAKR